MIEPGARVYFDSNVCIYHLEETPIWGERAKAFFVEANRVGARLVTSELSVGECLIHPHRIRDATLLRVYARFFADDAVRKMPVDLAVLKSAAELAGLAKLRLFDAIHVATALFGGCDAFVTNDARIRSVGGLRVLPLVDFGPSPPRG